MMKLLQLVSTWVLAALLVTAYEGYDDGLTVQTSSGSIRGFIENSATSVRQFRGIPFARPPVNSLRWLPPKALPSTAANNTVRAIKYPPGCPQRTTFDAPSVYGRDVPEFVLRPNQTVSEDCLYLTVWAPAAKKQQKLPVFVWIYGGGFSSGATNVSYQIPTNWVQRSQEHIVVSIQYRVGIFGFPNAASLTDNNLGILDQRLALEWVRDNINAFGGDPARIVIWGQSAGGNSVDYLNFAFPKDPIASGLIADSGAAVQPLSNPDFAQLNFTNVARNFSCTNRQTEVSCLRNISSTRILAYLQQAAETGSAPGLLFFPIADEKVIFRNYTARYAAGQVARVPAIFGSNRDEGTALAPYPANPDVQGPDPATVDSITKSLFLCPAANTSVLRRAAGLQTYRFLFSGNFTNVSPRFWLGAYHCSELPHVFGTSALYRGPNTALENKVGQQMQNLWLSFAKNPSNPSGWAEYGATSQALVFGANGTAVQRVSVSSLDAVCSTAATSA